MRNPIRIALASVLVATLAGGCSSAETPVEQATSIAAFGVDGAAGRYVVTSGYA